MAKYVFTYHGGNGMPDDPAEAEAIMAAWGAWFGQLGEAVVDGGNPFGEAYTVAPDGTASQGPITPLGGYSVVTAADMAQAVAAAQGCPVLANGGSVQVSEAIEM